MGSVDVSRTVPMKLNGRRSPSGRQLDASSLFWTHMRDPVYVSKKNTLKIKIGRAHVCKNERDTVRQQPNQLITSQALCPPQSTPPPPPLFFFFLKYEHADD